MMEGMGPVIGLTSRTLELTAAARTRPVETVARAYLEPLEAAGALPVLLPNAADAARAEEYLELLDGLILTGGDDPHPRVFGEAPHPRIEKVDERRDRFEIALVRAAHAQGRPVLGICRGIQLMNIALGGDIYQDVASQTDSTVCHSQRTVGDATWHDVEVKPGTLLARLAGEGRRAVNSFHHQACRRPGAGLVVSATTVGDGLIEALEDPDHPFFLGVQWHPELGDAPDLGLFEVFVAAGRRRALPASNSGR